MTMKNVWLSMEHQVILWCKQLVIQVSHTLLGIIDPETGRPFHNTQKRMDILCKMLCCGVPQSFNWMNEAAHDFLKNNYKNGRPTFICVVSFLGIINGSFKVTVLAISVKYNYISSDIKMS